MFAVYILYSSTYDKIYIGFTSNIEERFKSHNELSKKGRTVSFRPGQIIHTEIFDDKRDAMRREKELKTARGREWIRTSIVTKL